MKTLFGLYLVGFGAALVRAGMKMLPPKMRNDFNKALVDAAREALK